MVLTTDKQRIKALLTETVTLLCKNGLHFKSEFSIEGLIGITLDQDDVFLVSIKETVRLENQTWVAASSENVASSSLVSSVTESRSMLPSEDHSVPLQTSSASRDSISHECPLNERREIDCTQSSVVRKRSMSDSQGTARLEHSNKSHDVEMTLSYQKSDNQGSGVDRGRASTFKPGEADSSEPAYKRLHALSTMSDDGHCATGESHSLANIEASQGVKAEEDIIEIKEESLSDSDVESSVNSANSLLMTSVSSAYGANKSSRAHQPRIYDTDYSAYMDTLPGCSTWDATQSAAANLYSATNQQSQANTSLTSEQLVVIGKCLFKRPPFDQLAAAAASKLQQAQTAQQKTASAETILPSESAAYRCGLCGKNLRARRDLRAHLSSKHDIGLKFMCLYCGANFSYKHNLKTHIVQRHMHVT